MRTEPSALSGHTFDCEWHCDQYPWECTCGASRRADLDASAAEHLQLVPMGDGRLKPALRRADVLVGILCLIGLTSFVWSFT